MSDAPQSPPTDPFAQMFQTNIPETVEDMRKLLDGFAGMLNNPTARRAGLLRVPDCRGRSAAQS